MKTLWLLAFLSPAVWSLTPPPWPREVSGQVCGHTRDELLTKLKAKDRESVEIAYFDTADLELQKKTVIVRLRIFADRGEVTVKLRADVPPSRTESAECEVDVGRDRALSSCAWKQDISLEVARNIMSGKKDIRDLLNKEQRSIVESSAGEVVAPWKLYGPVFAERFKIQDPKSSKRWRLERWAMSDGVVLLSEVSFQEKKTLPADELSQTLDRYLIDHKVNRCAQDEPKTNLVLKMYRGLIH